MTARAALIVTGLAAAAAAVLIMTTRSADSPSRPGPRQVSTAAADSAEPSSRIVQPRPDRPTLDPAGSNPARPRPGLSTPASWGSFDDEARDPSWAPEREQAVRDKLARLVAESGSKVEIDAVECRSHQCRFEVDGGESSTFQQFVETLQGDDGFHGDAAELLLQDYRPAGEDGSRAKVEVVLRYGREQGAGRPEPERPE